MKAYRLLRSPNSWTQGALARNEEGNPVSHKHRQAYKWCIVGALKKSYRCDEVRFEKQQMIIDYIERTFGFRFGTMYNSLLDSEKITIFNDHPETTHKMISKVLRECDA